jgi:hypothetical protein
MLTFSLSVAVVAVAQASAAVVALAPTFTQPMFTYLPGLRLLDRKSVV